MISPIAKYNTRRWFGRLILSLASLLAMAYGCGLLAVAAEAGGAEAAPKAVNRIGEIVRIPLPVDHRTVGRVKRFIDRAGAKAQAKNARLVLIFEFYVPKNQEESAGQTEFTQALELARTIAASGPSVDRTVAYIPTAIRGHAVLGAMACDEIVMPAEAMFGPVGVNPASIGPTEHSAYKEISSRRKKVPVEVALWLLEPSREVFVVETDLGREFVSKEGLEELIKSKRRVVKAQQPLKDLIQGVPGQMTGNEGRSLGFVNYLPKTRQDVAKALRLPPEAMNEDVALTNEKTRAIRIDVKGPIKAEKIRQTQRLIEDKIRLEEVDFICLWIDSPGGSLEDSVRLADTLAEIHATSLAEGPASEVRTVAYVPSQARADAALIALACEQVVVGPRAELGGSGAANFSEDEFSYARRIISNDQGPWKARPRSLVAAIIDPRMEVFQCRRIGDAGPETGYFTEDELRELDNKLGKGPKWQKVAQVTRPNEPLLVDGQKAVEYGLASFTANDFSEFKRLYGLENDLTLLEPGWADFLIDALASPGVAVVLLIIAFVALYAELHSPGLGLGGFVATVCFLLFFWSRYLGGTAGWLEVTLFVAGITCLLLEIFVLPGFGIFGLGGGLLVLLSLVLASQTSVSIIPRNDYQFAQLQRSLLTVAAAVAGVVAAAVLFRRWLPHAPVFSRVMLHPPVGEEAESIARRESLVDLSHLVGARGIVVTRLTPAGKVRFGDRLVDVVADGELIPRGSPVEVIEVHGNRVVVKAVEGD